MANQTTTQNVITTNALPQWYVDYISPIMQRAVGASNEPYQAYTGPRVAGMNADQLEVGNRVRGMQGMLTGPLTDAMNTTNAAGAVDSGAAGAGMFGQASDIFGRVAGSDTSGISQPYVDQGVGYLQQAGAGSSLGAANPYIQQSVSPLGLAAASPYMQAASQSFPGAAADYMNPYNSLVTDRIAQLGGRNLGQNLLPQISDQFVRSGQYGSPQQREGIYRAVRDTQDSILGQQAQVLQQGYGQAGQLFGQDQARYAQLAGTAGGLGTSQQQILQGAGSTLGNLSATDLSRLAAAGVNIGNLGLGQAGVAGADYGRQLAAGQGLQGIGQSQITAAGNDANRMLMAGQQTANIGDQAEQSTLRQIATLDAYGNQVQNQDQRNIDTAYGDFTEQRDYPWTQINRASNVLQGVPVNGTSSSTSQTTTPGPSTTSQVAGLGLGVAGLANSGIFRAKGGKVSGKQVKYKRSHSYGNMPKRGLAPFEEAA